MRKRSPIRRQSELTISPCQSTYACICLIRQSPQLLLCGIKITQFGGSRPELTLKNPDLIHHLDNSTPQGEQTTSRRNSNERPQQIRRSRLKFVELIKRPIRIKNRLIESPLNLDITVHILPKIATFGLEKNLPCWPSHFFPRL